jgi:branched-chain amino acid transport system substrate-binding protein
VNGVPCLSTMAPWQSWFMTRGGDPAVGFDWTYHYFWGTEDIISVFTNMWNKLETNRQVGMLFPNDADGNALIDPNVGFPPGLTQAGYMMTDPGRYQNLSDDFTAYISAFQQSGCEIVTGVPLPPDFTTFWTQAKQQGFNPKCVSVGKATLYPANVETLGAAGHNLSSEVWWTPTHPYVSSLTGQSGAELAAAYTEATGRQWTQPIGFIHSLFEIAADIMTRASGPGDYAVTRDAMAATNLNTLVGPISWGAGPVKNVTKTPLVGGQWRLTEGARFPYDIVVVSNETAPEVPLGGDMEALA